VVLKALELEKRGFLSARDETNEKENKWGNEGTYSKYESNRFDRLKAMLVKLISKKSGSSNPLCSINESNHRVFHNTKNYIKNSTDQRVFHNTKNCTRNSTANNYLAIGLKTNTMQNCTK
jgi:hypothetical protein